MTRNTIVMGIAAIVVVAIIIGIVALRSRPTPQAPSIFGPSLPPSHPAPERLKAAPDIEIVMYQGEAEVGGSKIHLSQLWKKGQPVVLNFWAGLCPPCRAEMPDFQLLYRKLAKGKFTLIGIDIGPFVGLGSREEGKALLRELKIVFPAGTTFGARTVENYQILGMPTTVFITPDGKIYRKHTGLLTREQMFKFTEELLRASGVQ